MEKVVNRGYVKWTDEDGVFHKEPLADHPDMLAKASPEEQLRAEEVRRLNEAAEDAINDREDNSDEDAKDTLEALKKAPKEVLTAAQLTNETVPASAAEEPVQKGDPVHEEALMRLREETSE